MPNEPEMRIMNLLQKYMDKNFVQRLFLPKLYPRMERPDLGPGNFSTHLMSYGTAGNKYIVYPEIIYDQKTSQLKRLGGWEAQDYAIKNNEFIPFDTEEEAANFSQYYKSAFPPGHFD